MHATQDNHSSSLNLKGIALLLALTAIGGAVLLLPTLTVKPPVLPDANNALTLRESFRAHIVSVGGEKAYADFKKQYAGVGINTQHTAAHLFGQALYSVQGISGVSVCDSDFNFGCYHGFFLPAVSSEGLSVLPALDVACVSARQPSACQHGIGHGIMEFFGSAHLTEALTACNAVNQPNPVAGCTSGVFMEYNTPFVANADGTYAQSIRPFTDSKNPYDVCPTLPENFQLSCYHELPQWWDQVSSHNFRQMGNWCANIENKKYQSACMERVGDVIPVMTGYDPSVAKTICKSMPENLQSLCFVGAAVSFESNARSHVKSQALCREARPEDQAECTAP